MAKTSTDLANAILEDLGKAGDGQPPEASDTEKALERVQSMFQRLSSESIFEVADPNDIDEGAFPWLTAAGSAFDCAAVFFVPVNPQKLEYAENRLRRMNSSDPTYQAQQAEYF